jgi:hypothetical protein
MLFIETEQLTAQTFLKCFGQLKNLLGLLLSFLLNGLESIGGMRAQGVHNSQHRFLGMFWAAVKFDKKFVGFLKKVSKNL